MRTAGILMLFLCCTGAGFCLAGRFSARVGKLEQADRMLTEIIGMVYHQNLPTADILSRLRQEGYPLGENASAADAIKTFADDPLFRQEERAVLIGAGQLFGTLDRESQADRLKLEQENLRHILCSAKKEQEINGRLCRSAGVLAGALAAILAI